MEPIALPTPQALSEFTGDKSWFPTEGRFGVFLHLGLYSITGREENDRMGLSPDDYAKTFLSRFNPVAFSAEEWVNQIKAAGASHLVLTTRHGEGFCLWDTQSTEFKVTNTPFGRDLLKELAEACQKLGLRLGLYYAADNWHYFGGDEAKEPEPGAYHSFVRRQVFELLENYGPVSLFWFDGSSPLIGQDAFARLVNDMRSRQPGMVINNRGLNHSDPAYERVGDYLTPERFFPAAINEDTAYIEVCDAMGQKSWGYHRDEVFISGAECIRRLTKAASLGGNYLLNVEPCPEGPIRPECVERLALIGRWLETNRASVFGTTGCPLKPSQTVEQEPLELGVATQKGRTVYLHLTTLPVTDEIIIPGLSGEVKSIRINGEAVPAKHEILETGFRLTGLPAEYKTDNPVIRIEFADTPEVKAGLLVSEKQRVSRVEAHGPSELRASHACVLPGSSGISTNQIEAYANGTLSIGRWVDIGSRAKWVLEVEKAGLYRLYARLGASKPQSGALLEFRAGRNPLTLRVPETGSYQDFRTVEVGVLELENGIQDLMITLTEAHPFGPNIHGLALLPCSG